MQEDSKARKEKTAGSLIAAIDDDFRVRESIQSLLESAGYIPVLFATADEFLGARLLDRVACVITDVWMPGTDGIRLQRHIKAQHPLLPVIFISAHVSHEVRQAALLGGAVEFLYKPFDAAELLNAIQMALSESR